MPEDYGSLKLKVPKGKGDGADAPQAFKDFADSITKPATGATGQIAIIQNTGAIAYQAMKGDVTIAEDGTVTIGNEKVTNAKIGKKAVGGENLNDKAIGAGHIADTLKPSGGAAAGTEALRALGTSASTAAAGNDSRLTDERTPKDGTVTPPKMAAIASGAIVAGEKLEWSGVGAQLLSLVGSGTVKKALIGSNGHVMTIIVNSGPVTFKASAEEGGLQLASEFVASAGDTLTLAYYVSFKRWVEVCRSNNV